MRKDLTNLMPAIESSPLLRNANNRHSFQESTPYEHQSEFGTSNSKYRRQRHHHRHHHELINQQSAIEDGSATAGSMVSDSCSVTGFSSERRDNIDYDLGKILLETIVFERIDQLQQQKGIDQEQAFSELFFSKSEPGEIVCMAFEDLRDPRAFTMAEFLPLFANMLVK